KNGSMITAKRSGTSGIIQVLVLCSMMKKKQCYSSWFGVENELVEKIKTLVRISWLRLYCGTVRRLSGGRVPTKCNDAFGPGRDYRMVRQTFYPKELEGGILRNRGR